MGPEGRSSLLKMSLTFSCAWNRRFGACGTGMRKTSHWSPCQPQSWLVSLKQLIPKSQFFCGSQVHAADLRSGFDLALPSMLTLPAPWMVFLASRRSSFKKHIAMKGWLKEECLTACAGFALKMQPRDIKQSLCRSGKDGEMSLLDHARTASFDNFRLCLSG